ncbi:hypothetical protein MTY_0790 [Moorella thermoacetica Y72]|uniref:Uncharacterized protein n=1 Tax=Moorella thermoacetica Y72 TaxID=1325331 RepID=A0A0S6U8M2_NEOTH|nr:hypothetical protein MTY_0790 [Moorella thermoacetica Y72]
MRLPAQQESPCYNHGQSYNKIIDAYITPTLKHLCSFIDKDSKTHCHRIFIIPLFAV